MKAQIKFYGIQITRGKRVSLAVNGKGGYALYSRKQDAEPFRRDLANHLDMECKIVRVHATFEWRSE